MSNHRVRRHQSITRSHQQSWGITGIVIHWLSAVLVLGLFALGLWMTSLDYYDPWYKQGPQIHKGFGVVLFALLAGRLLWRLAHQSPPPIASHAPWERHLAQVVHLLLYLLLLIVMLSGYLISTADGRDLEVFGWFGIPALPLGIEHQEDIAGAVHYYLACTLIATVALHIAGALKHHFVDRDETLLRMIHRR